MNTVMAIKPRHFIYCGINSLAFLHGFVLPCQLRQFFVWREAGRAPSLRYSREQSKGVFGAPKRPTIMSF